MSRRRRALVLSGAIVLVLLLAAAVTAAVVILPRAQLPEPTGPHAIGTTVRTWTDESRPEPFTEDRQDRRALVAQVWYPADPRPDAGTAPYTDEETVAALAERFGFPQAAMFRLADSPTHAVPDAPPVDGRFPVLIYVTGSNGFRGVNQAWVEELVSHGYVVIGLDQPGTAVTTIFPDGRTIPAIDRGTLVELMPLATDWDEGGTHVVNGVELPGGIIPFLAQDASFALDRAGHLDADDDLLAGHLDTDRAGVFGPSLGGYVVGEACRTDPHFGACLEADAGQTAATAAEGIEQPLMIMTRDASSMRREREQAGGWPESDVVHTIETQRALFEHSAGPAWYLTMNEMHHVNWTDAPLWTPTMQWSGLAGPIDPRRGHEAVTAWSLAFFDQHLKDRPSPLLEGPSADWPEVGVERR